MADDKSDKEFTVVDRRISTEEEEFASKSAGPEDQADSKADSQQEAAKKSGGSQASAETTVPHQAEPAGTQKAEAGPAPRLTFPTFLLSLHSSALIHLGLIPDPISNQKSTNLELARQNIDLLEMLKEKTEGNRTDDENKLLDNILYELRMVYVQVCEAGGGEECKV